jgi:hypothetical protein
MSSISFNPIPAQSIPDVAQAGGQSDAQTQPTVPAAAQDTVKLSQAAQVAQLYDSGQSVSSIASTLGVSKTLVDSYLGIVEQTAISTAGASAGGAAGGSSSASTSSGASGSSTPSAETIQAAAAQIQTATADPTVKQALSVTA